MIHLQTAVDNLADAIWWFKGFGAGRSAHPFDDGPPQQGALEGQTRTVRQYLAAILDGQRRLLAPGRDEAEVHNGSKVVTERQDGGLMAISYAEIERISDGLRTASTDDDRADARRVLSKILEEWMRDVQTTSGADTPF